MYNGGQLYAVKLRNAETYETGSQSYVAPRIYTRKGDATQVAKRNNALRDSALRSYSDKNSLLRQAQHAATYSDDPPDVYIANFMKLIEDNHIETLNDGEWVVVEVSIKVENVLAE